MVRRARRTSRDEVREERVARFLPARAGVDDAEASLRERSPRDLQEQHAEQLESTAPSKKRAVVDALRRALTQGRDLLAPPVQRIRRGRRHELGQRARVAPEEEEFVPEFLRLASQARQGAVEDSLHDGRELLLGRRRLGATDPREKIAIRRHRAARPRAPPTRRPLPLPTSLTSPENTRDGRTHFGA